MKGVIKRLLCGLLTSCMILAGVSNAGLTLAFAADSTDSDEKVAVVDSFEYDINGKYTGNLTSDSNLPAASGSVAVVEAFFNTKGVYHVVFRNTSAKKLYIQRYNSDMKLDSEFKADLTFEKYGGVLCDEIGDYYILTGKEDTSSNSNGTAEVLCITKYSSSGVLLGAEKFTGIKTSTKNPFYGGGCDMAVRGNVLACSYSGTDYDGSNKNHVLYINTDTLKQVDYFMAANNEYTIDQRAILTQSGDFLFVDQSAARGFSISKVMGGYGVLDSEMNGVQTFHFSEGLDYTNGYLETFAQLGSVCDGWIGYILVAASERELSLKTRAYDSSDPYKSYNTRDVFFQVINKNYQSGSTGVYVMEAVDRMPADTKNSNPLTKTFLYYGITDKNVRWVTKYPEGEYAANPKAVMGDNGELIIMWEHMKYKYKNDGLDNDERYLGTYYAVYDSLGNVKQEATRIQNLRLTSNEDPEFRDGYVYWTTLQKCTNADCTVSGSHSSIRINRLKVGALTDAKVDVTGITLDGELLDTKALKNEIFYYTIGDSIKLNASVYPENASDSKIEYKVSDSKVASIDSKGNLNIKKKGDFTVTLIANGMPDTEYEMVCEAVNESPDNFRISSTTSTSVKLKWSKIKGNTEGYTIIFIPEDDEAVSENPELRGTLAPTTDRELAAGTRYFTNKTSYKIKGLELDKGYYITIIQGEYTDDVTLGDCGNMLYHYLPSGMSGVKVKETASGAKLTWKKNSLVTGYEVYRSETEDGNYRYVTRTTKNTKKSYTDKKIEENKEYYYRVRTYVLIDGKRYYSKYSVIRFLPSDLA